MGNKEPCGSGLKATNGGKNLDCQRTDRHLVHRDKDTDQKFVRVPLGAFAEEPKKS